MNQPTKLERVKAHLLFLSRMEDSGHRVKTTKTKFERIEQKLEQGKRLTGLQENLIYQQT